MIFYNIVKENLLYFDTNEQSSYFLIIHIKYYPEFLILLMHLLMPF